MNPVRIQRLKGKVVSTKMAKTVVVSVTRLKKHPRYHKFIRVTKKYKAHDENGFAKEGSTIIIESTRPISKDKRWKVVEENV